MKSLKSLIPNSFFVFLLLVSGVASAQYADIDARVRTYPKSFSNSQALAQKIDADFDTDTEKVRAAFTWIATNIVYDMKEFREGSTIAYSYSSQQEKIRKEKQFREALVKRTLVTGMGICEGYSSLFVDLCKKMGIEAVIVPGTSRNHHTQIGKLPTASDHAWNAVKVDGSWQLLDLAWAAGVVDAATGKFRRVFNDVYFFTDPDKFFLNHFPDEKKWLLTNRSPQDFASQPYFYPTYIRSGYKIDADMMGTIELPPNAGLQFTIENLKPEDRVYYITSRDNVLDRLRVSRDNKVMIYPSAKLSGYLTLFINEKPVVSYKIERT